LLLAASLACITACQSANRLEYGKGLDVPYLQTPPNVVTAMLQMAHVGPNDVVVDLGCGDGRIIVAAAKEFGARGVGYDIDPQRISEARRNAERAGVTARAQFVEKDLFDVRISEATVVTAFLLPPVLERLRPRLLGDLAPGTRIVSHSFPIRNWKPDQKLKVEGRTLYLFTVPKMAECTTATPAGIDQTPPCLDRQSPPLPTGK
jgi:SAM-dependent methyltransferase